MTMKMDNKVLELDPSEIKSGWRARKDYGDISDLAASIKEVGQLEPILIRRTKRGYYLIAGARRLRACKKLGVKVRAIVASPTSELHGLQAQLEENLKRKDFDKLELSEGLARLKVVWEKLHPETKHGGDRRSTKAEKGDRAERFTVMASRSLGMPESSLQEVLRLSQLPAAKKAKINQAKTSAQRNKEAAAAQRGVRYAAKAKKLEEQAKAKAASKPKRAGPPVQLRRGNWQDVLKDFENESVDVIMTDPPFELKRSTITHTTRASINEEGERMGWDQLDVGWVIETARVLTKGGRLIAHCPAEAIGDYVKAINAAGLVYKGHVAWHKTNPTPATRNAFAPSMEYIVWAAKGPRPYFKAWKNAGVAEAHNLIEGPACGGNERLDHPAQKPLWLMEKLLDRFVQKGELVLDPFAGTGTTLVACKKKKLQAYGIEKSAKYARLAAARLKAL